MNIDISNWEFLDKDLKYYTFDEFCSKNRLIKYKFEQLTDTQKAIYHLYIYANQHMTQTYKDRIMEYLMEDCDEEELYKILQFYKPRYRNK